MTVDGAGRLAICPGCDWVLRLPRLAAGESAHCPRCDRRLTTAPAGDYQTGIALGLATLILLVLALSFEFLSFETRGAEQRIVLLDTATALFDYRYAVLGLVVAATTVVLPALYVAVGVYLSLSLAFDRRLPGAADLAHLLRPVRPWLMSDVFLVGVLVSLVKIVSMAEIHVGPSFLAFVGYALLLLQTLNAFRRHHFWERFGDLAPPPPGLRPGRSAGGQGFRPCATCGFPCEIGGECARCGLRHTTRVPDRLEATWALLITAAILYVPANVYPIMRTKWLGDSEPQTIVGGILQLVETGSWPIAIVIFLASLVVPIGKIGALAWLCLRARRGIGRGRSGHLWLYRITAVVGRWSMIDVFVVAVLAALVQSGRIVSVHPGPAAVAFAAVVIITMLAAMTFDTRLLWNDAAGIERSEDPA